MRLRCPCAKSDEEATGFFLGGSTGKTILPKILGPLSFSKRTLICSGGKLASTIASVLVGFATIDAVLLAEVEGASGFSVFAVSVFAVSDLAITTDFSSTFLTCGLSASFLSIGFFSSVFFTGTSTIGSSFFLVFFLPASRSILPRIFGASTSAFALITSGSALTSSFFLIDLFSPDAANLISSKLFLSVSSLSCSISFLDSGFDVIASITTLSRFNFSRVTS